MHNHYVSQPSVTCYAGKVHRHAKARAVQKKGDILTG